MVGYIGNIPVPQATQTRNRFTAANTQSTFATSGYTPGFVDVYMNGIRITNGVDFTASNGSDIVLTDPADEGDVLEVISLGTFQTGDFVPVSGGYFNGNVGVFKPNPNTALDVIGTVNANTFSIEGIAITATATELNFVDGVTSSIQTQLDAKVAKTSSTGSAVIPSGTEAERDVSPTAGYFRYNTDLAKFEGYTAAGWGSVGGGATGGGSDDVFVENGQTVTTDYTISTNKNAMSVGPISINSGITVTIPSGSNWVVL